MFAKQGEITRNSKAKASSTKPVRIGDLLLEKQMITQEQIEHALSYQRDKGHKKLLGEILVELKYVNEEQVCEVLAQAYDVPFARLTSKLADPKIIESLPREFLEKYNVLPLFLVRGTMTVAIHEPTNVFLIEEIAKIANCKIQIVAATIKDIQRTLQAHTPSSNVFVIDDIVDDAESDSSLNVTDDQVLDLADFDDASGDSPVIKLVNYMIYTAANEGASDIHVEPGDKSMRIRMRIDGRLYEKLRPPYQMHAAVASRIKIMAGLDISERRMPQDGAISVMISKRPVDLRVSTMPGKFGEKVVMRVIDNKNLLATLDKLGFENEMLLQFREMLHQPNGIILVTGPTGSGKSTTLYSALNEINDDAINICTVEDPVEFNLEGINQFQVNEKAGFTFSSALRSLLRQDPDVVMLGEIRDAETAKIATQAALTGHVVLSTLHTNDAPSAVTRLFNIGVEPYLVAAAIRGVLAQRLLRSICPVCKEEVDLLPKERQMLEKVYGQAIPFDKIYKGMGCSKCHETGCRGRVGIYELFIPDEEILEAVSRGIGLQELRRLAKATGYTTLAEDGLEKVKRGLITPQELLTAVAMS